MIHIIYRYVFVTNICAMKLELNYQDKEFEICE